MKRGSLTLISLFAFGLSGLASANAQHYGSGNIGGYTTTPSITVPPGGDARSTPLPIGATVKLAYENGKQQLEAGNYAEAEDIFRRLIRDYRDNTQILEGLGMAHFGQEDWKLAAAAFRHSVSSEPSNHHARLLLGLSHLEMGEHTQATKQLAQFQSQMEACGDTCAPALVDAATFLQDAIAKT